MRPVCRFFRSMTDPFPLPRVDACAAAARDCADCLHGVAVRGRVEYVCLAFLSVCPRSTAHACQEFDPRPSRKAPTLP